MEWYEIMRLIVVWFLSLYLRGKIYEFRRDYDNKVIKIEGLHNCYWDIKDHFLLPDVNDNIKNYSSKQEKIIETANKTSKEIDDLMFKLIKYSKKVNEKYLL